MTNKSKLPQLVLCYTDRFEEFIRGLLGMSVFHAADCWLPSTEDQLYLACSSVQDPELCKWTSFSSAVTFPSGVSPVGRIYEAQAAMWHTEYSQVRSFDNLLLRRCLCSGPLY
jgi:hypothetical protein